MKIVLNNLMQTAIITVFLIICFGCNSSLTGETTGKVYKVLLDQDEDVDTEIIYRYTVKGREYMARAEKDGDLRNNFQENMKVIVCYNPNDPQRSNVFPANHKCDN